MSYVFKHQTDKKIGAFGICCVCTLLPMVVSVLNGLTTEILMMCSVKAYSGESENDISATCIIFPHFFLYFHLIII